MRATIKTMLETVAKDQPDQALPDPTGIERCWKAQNGRCAISGQKLYWHLWELVDSDMIMNWNSLWPLLMPAIQSYVVNGEQRSMITSLQVVRTKSAFFYGTFMNRIFQDSELEYSPNLSPLVISTFREFMASRMFTKTLVPLDFLISRANSTLMLSVALPKMPGSTANPVIASALKVLGYLEISPKGVTYGLQHSHDDFDDLKLRTVNYANAEDYAGWMNDFETRISYCVRSVAEHTYNDFKEHRRLWEQAQDRTLAQEYGNCQPIAQPSPIPPA